MRGKVAEQYLSCLARVSEIHLELLAKFESEAEIANRRYASRVPDHLFVVMQNKIADTSKGDERLSSFSDYALGARKEGPSNTNLFFQ